MPITAEDLRGIEKSFSSKCKLPSAYKAAVKKHGLPTLVPELSNRVKDLMEDYPTIGRFYSPQEMKDLSEAIRTADKTIIRCKAVEYYEDEIEDECFVDDPGEMDACADVEQDCFAGKDLVEVRAELLEEGAKELIAFASDGMGRHLCYTHIGTEYHWRHLLTGDLSVRG